MSTDRIRKIFIDSWGSRFYILYGIGIDDVYISADLKEQSIEDVLLVTLEELGYSRILFHSPYKSIYSRNRDGQTDFNEISQSDYSSRSTNTNSQSLVGPLNLNNQPLSNSITRNNFKAMGDVHAIRTIDTFMRDVNGTNTAIIFTQAETLLRYYDDPRTLAGIIGDWSRLPTDNQNICLFLFAADDIQAFNLIASSIPIPEIRNIFLQHDKRINGVSCLHEIQGPDLKEIINILKFYCRSNEILMPREDIYQLSRWISAEGGKARLWINRFQSVADMTLKAMRNYGWFSAYHQREVSAIEKLEQLTGLRSVKDRIIELYHWITYQNAVRETIVDKDTSPALHYIFTGNPGTGKTTVARLMGEIFHDVGILSRGHLVEARANDLVAEFVGGTTSKTNEVIDRAIGGVLFIDEAYMLTEKERGGFGQEALDTLLSRMEDTRYDMVVIVAGYSDRMRNFIDSNPGLARRFPTENILEFPDFSTDELWDILLKFLRNQNIRIDESTSAALIQVIEELYRNKDETFGNAGEIRNLVDGLARKRAARIMEKQLALDAPLEIIDIPPHYQSNLISNEIELEKSLQPLKSLIGLGNLKNFVEDLIYLTKFEKLKKNSVSTIPSGIEIENLIFIGNPGTGKTTSARLLGEIYKSLGLLKKGHLIEANRSDLVAEYVGQTATRTKNKVREAIDGVLLIEDAIFLVDGGEKDFGFEAIHTLIKCMDQYHGRLLVIVTGNTRDIENFLSSNSGLNPRFNRRIIFEDFSNDELISIFENYAKNEGILYDQEVAEAITNYLENERYTFQMKFGNARSIRSLFYDMKKNMAKRLVDQLDGTTLLSHLRFISDDIQSFSSPYQAVFPPLNNDKDQEFVLKQRTRS